MGNPKELARFVENPNYRMKVLRKLNNGEHKAYISKVRTVEAQRDQLVQSRENEIARIEESRWERVTKTFLINRTEGKIRVNNIEALYSDIQGVDLYMLSGVKTVTRKKSKSRKQPSLGGVIAGGMVAGSIGAVVGGSVLGQTQTNGTSVSNSFATCQHLGVMVRVGGNASEIVLISRETEQSNRVFMKAYQQAQSIIAQIEMLRNTPVPTEYLLPEQEETVLAISSQIESKNAELQAVTDNRPTYRIPEIYRTAEQRAMTDDEYLSYLNKMDKNRKKADKALGKAATVIVWIIFGSTVLYALASLITECIASFCLFLITAVLICPAIIELVNRKIFHVKLWMVIVIASAGMTIASVLMTV